LLFYIFVHSDSCLLLFVKSKWYNGARNKFIDWLKNSSIVRLVDDFLVFVSHIFADYTSIFFVFPEIYIFCINL